MKNDNDLFQKRSGTSWHTLGDIPDVESARKALRRIQRVPGRFRIVRQWDNELEIVMD